MQRSSDLPDTLIEQIRLSRRLHSSRKEGFFKYLFNSWVITLEILVRQNFGEAYLNLGRIVTALSLFLCYAEIATSNPGLFSINDLVHRVIQGTDAPEAKPTPSPSIAEPQNNDSSLQSLLIPDNINKTIGKVNTLVTGTMSFFSFVGNLHFIPWFHSESNRLYRGVDLLWLAMLLFGFVFGWHRLWSGVRRRIGVRWNPAYPGDSWTIWNFFYLLLHKLRFRTDLVKILIEPSILLIFGLWLSAHWNTTNRDPTRLESIRDMANAHRFMVTWLISGVFFSP